MPQQRHDEYELPYRQFETREQVRDRAYDLSDNLKKSKDDRHQELAKKLDCCSTGDPCGSGACPRCMRDARLPWIRTVDHLVGEWTPKPKRAFLTIVLPDLLILPAALSTFDPRAFKDRIAHLLDRAGLGHLAVIGGIDFALTVWKVFGQTYWQPHLHAITWCPEGVAWTEALLREQIKATKLVDNPVDLRPITENLPRLAGYTLKSMFWKRKPKTDGFGNPCVEEDRLPTWARRELAMYLDSIRIEARQFRRNVEWHNGSLRTSAEALARIRQS